MCTEHIYIYTDISLYVFYSIRRDFIITFDRPLSFTWLKLTQF